MGIRLIIASLDSVQRAYVSREMKFKKFFYSNLCGVVVSAIVGFLIAYLGGGIWALVFQSLIQSFVNAVVLWFTVRWRPTFIFSLMRLKGLFSFGWKLLCSTLIGTVYVELTDLLVGKCYGTFDLAYFNKGKNFPKLIMCQVYNSIDAVLFPAMSKHQDDPKKLKDDVRYSIRFSSFFSFPILFALAVIAKDLVVLLLTEKWLNSVIYLQIACVSFMVYPIGLANLQAIKAMGRSDIYLKLDVVKKIAGISLLCIFLKKGVLAIAIADALSYLVGLVINIYPNKKLLGYSFFEMMKDVFPSLFFSVLMSFAMIVVGLYIDFSLIIKIFLQVLLGIMVYIGTCFFFKYKVLFELFDIVKMFKDKSSV
jgi:O-antigen/teichoic acid export membrane protein